MLELKENGLLIGNSSRTVIVKRISIPFSVKHLFHNVFVYKLDQNYSGIKEQNTAVLILYNSETYLHIVLEFKSRFT